MDNKKLFLVLLLALPFLAFWKEGASIFSSLDNTTLLIGLLYSALTVVVILELADFELPKIVIGAIGVAILAFFLIDGIFLSDYADLFDSKLDFLSYYFSNVPLSFVSIFGVAGLSVIYAIKGEEL